jgi:1-acyl-sn-glycerol-3-phosphate acyltransferase
VNSPTAFPRRGRWLSRTAGRAVLALARFRIVGSLPERPKAVVIVAPHSSNWDFIVGLAARNALGVDASWLAKHTLFRWPLGPLFRRWGGIAIDRRAAHDVVSQVVDRFGAQDKLWLAITPEGTRKAVVTWKTGFWHIAHGAAVPIVPVALDWGQRAIVIGPAVDTTDDIDADIAALRGRYADVRGRRARGITLSS